ncbi:MAG: Hydrolase, alpha/beta fold family [uncultured Paraburkholderia sp.]|nr:MAG: Hydrolase, alpha/beta fold family [uncultured Paraburkholderia sp.]CAH2946248.1 MAG: Hydrolase, alpha/beta fold family [uncultured Paraburkholderia sp.]
MYEKEKKTSFYSDGFRLSATMTFPNDYEPGQRRPAVLICHGRFAIKEWVPSRWTPRFLAAGFVCMTFDYRNLGESEGSPGTIIPQEEVRDVSHAITFLQQQPEVDPQAVGILGWGLGGGVAVCAAARDDRIKAVVCASGVANGREYGKVGLTEKQWEMRQAEIREDRVRRVIHGDSRKIPRAHVLGAPDQPTETSGTQQGWFDSLVVGPERAADSVKLGIPDEISLESMEALYEFLPDAQAHLIAPRPLLVIHSSEDHEFPYEHVRRLYEAAKEPKQLIEVRGAGHLDWIDPQHPATAIYMPQVISWMQAQLPIHR